MLTFALLMSARMGIFQEILYKQYGKHSKEALFYNVSLGFFFFFKICLDTQDTPRMVHQPEGKPSFQMSRLDFYFPFLSLGSTAYLCQASCFSPQTSTTTVCSSVKAVSPFPSSRKCCVCVFLLADLNLIFLCFSAPVNIPVIDHPVPIMWLYMLGNIITQYPVKKGQQLAL